MVYKIFIHRSAQKNLAKLPVRDYQTLKDAIHFLAENPRPAGVKKLKNRSAWRIRKGNYRIIYEIKDDQLIVVIVQIGHRKDIYK